MSLLMSTYTPPAAAAKWTRQLAGTFPAGEGGADEGIRLVVEHRDSAGDDSVRPCSPPAHPSLALQTAIGYQIDSHFNPTTADPLPRCPPCGVIRDHRHHPRQLPHEFLQSRVGRHLGQRRECSRQIPHVEEVFEPLVPGSACLLVRDGCSQRPPSRLAQVPAIEDRRCFGEHFVPQAPKPARSISEHHLGRAGKTMVALNGRRQQRSEGGCSALWRHTAAAAGAAGPIQCALPAWTTPTLTSILPLVLRVSVLPARWSRHRQGFLSERYSITYLCEKRLWSVF